MKNIIRFIDDNTALVSKAFMKKASIFGTDEFKLWREYKVQFPYAKMTTKDIKKNPNKKTSTKNMTYQNMETYIRTLDNAEQVMAEFKREIARSKVQANPYRHVLAWFLKKFDGHNSYIDFFASLAEENSDEAAALASPATV